MKAWVRSIARNGTPTGSKQLCNVGTIRKSKEIIVDRDTFSCDMFLPFPKEPNSNGHVSLYFKDSEGLIKKLRIRFLEKTHLKSFVTAINKLQRGETTWKEPEQEWLASLKDRIELLPSISGLEHHTLFHIYVDSEIINLSGETPKAPDDEIVRGKSAALVRSYFPDVTDCSMKSNIAMLKYIKKFRAETMKKEEDESSGPETDDEEVYGGSREYRESSMSQNTARRFVTSFSDGSPQRNLHEMFSQITGLSSTSLDDLMETGSSSVRVDTNIPSTEPNNVTNCEDFLRNIICKTENVAEMPKLTQLHGTSNEVQMDELQVQENFNIGLPVIDTSEESVSQSQVDTTASPSMAYNASFVPEQAGASSREIMPKTKNTAKRCLPLPSPDVYVKRMCLENTVGTNVRSIDDAEHGMRPRDETDPDPANPLMSLSPNSTSRIDPQREETVYNSGPTDCSVSPEDYVTNCASMPVTAMANVSENNNGVEMTQNDTSTGNENQIVSGVPVQLSSQKTAELPAANDQQAEAEDVKPEAGDVKPVVSGISVKDHCQDTVDFSGQGTAGIITYNQVAMEQRDLKLRVDAAVDNTFFMLYGNPRRDEIAREVGIKLRDGFLALAEDQGLDSFGRVSSQAYGLELLPQDGFEARLKRMFALCDQFLTGIPSRDYCVCCNTREHLEEAKVQEHMNSCKHLRKLRNFTILSGYDQDDQFRVSNFGLKRAQDLLSKVQFPLTYEALMDQLQTQPICMETALDLICHLKSSSAAEGIVNNEDDDIQIIGVVQKDPKRVRIGHSVVKKEELIEDDFELSAPHIFHRGEDNVQKNSGGNGDNSHV